MLRVKGHALLITTVIHFLLTASPQIVGPHTLKKATRHLEEQRVSGGLDVNTLRGAVRSIGILHGIYPLHIAGEGDPQNREVVGINRTDNSLLHQDIRRLLDQLAAAGPFIACPWDSTLLGDLQGLAGTKWLLAANFKDNAEILPNFIKQVWLLAALLPSSSLFVSVYESGSEDATTGQWLEVFSNLLSLADVQHTIVTDGAIQRADGEERIEFLAKVRNKTLEPLWRHSNMSRESGGAWEADRIIFSNDVYLCTKDIVRLMLHKVDVVCGLDYGERTQDQSPEDVAAMEQSREEHTYGSQSRRLLDEMHIYDQWVLRDGRGHVFDAYPPYASIQSAYTSARLAAGLPFPVTTCWNGLAILPARPFYHGLRFRSHMPGECRASECSLLSHDLHRLGYGRMVVDPGVQVAYNHWDAAGMHIEAVVGPGVPTHQAEGGPPLEAYENSCMRPGFWFRCSAEGSPMIGRR